MNIKNINIDDLDLSLQTRAETNTEVAAEYAELMDDGIVLPPITVFLDHENKYLADGFHRVAAARSLGRKEMSANLINGNRAAALTYAFKANAEHGLRRTNADKRRALELAWENRDCLFNGEKVTERLLAAKCCVSNFLAHDFIEKSGVVENSKTEKEGPSERSVKKLLKEGKDRFGMLIPEKILPVFQSGDVRKLFRDVKKIRAEISKHLNDKDLAFSALNQQVLINLDNAAIDLKFSEPYCVCRICQSEGCYRCHDRGFLTRSQYDSLPSEFKFQTEK